MTTNDNESMPEAPFGFKYLIMDADISRETAIREKPTATFGYTPMQWMCADGDNANWHVLDWRKAQCDAITDKMIEQQTQMGIETSREKAVENQIDIYLARHARLDNSTTKMLPPTVPPPKPRPDWLQEIIATATRSIFRFG